MEINTLVNSLFNRSIIILLFFVYGCKTNTSSTNNENYISYISFTFDGSSFFDTLSVKNELLTYFNNVVFYYEGNKKNYSCNKKAFYSQNIENSRLYNVLINADSSIYINVFYVNKYGELKPFANPGKFQFRESLSFIEDTSLTPLSLFVADCIIGCSIK